LDSIFRNSFFTQPHKSTKAHKHTHINFVKVFINPHFSHSVLTTINKILDISRKIIKFFILFSVFKSHPKMKILGCGSARHGGRA